MAVRYNKLWKILIDKKMRKKDLQEAAHITHYQMMKLARDENITTEVVEYDDHYHCKNCVGDLFN